MDREHMQRAVLAESPKFITERGMDDPIHCGGLTAQTIQVLERTALHLGTRARNRPRAPAVPSEAALGTDGYARIEHLGHPEEMRTPDGRSPAALVCERVDENSRNRRWRHCLSGMALGKIAARIRD